MPNRGLAGRLARFSCQKWRSHCLCCSLGADACWYHELLHRHHVSSNPTSFKSFKPDDISIWFSVVRFWHIGIAYHWQSEKCLLPRNCYIIIPLLLTWQQWAYVPIDIDHLLCLLTISRFNSVPWGLHWLRGCDSTWQGKGRDSDHLRWTNTCKKQIATSKPAV